ncbi:MAG: hypothetical protein WBW71_04805, partial [Bacteroidota bacterium]
MKNEIKKIAIRIWDSPTIMSWGSFSARLLSSILVLPLILRKFSPAEIGLWYLFSSVTIIQLFADMGFVDTFIRAISYGVGGAKITEIRDFSHIVKREQGKNWDTIRTLWGTVQHVYLGLTALVILAYVFGGTFFFIRPISLVQNPNEAWIAWGIVITAGTIQ